MNEPSLSQRGFKLNQRRLDTIHLPLWILKDTFWMMEYKQLAVLMVLPTISVALLLCIKSYPHLRRLLLNSAVLCWISANSFWMLNDFFDLGLSVVSLCLFMAGLVCVGFHFLLRWKRFQG